jgi:phage-related protein
VNGDLRIFVTESSEARAAPVPMDDIAFLRYRRIMRWVVETLNPVVDAEIGALPADMRARFVRFIDIIEEVGFEALPRDSVKHLEDRLWELRMTGRDGISRAIYVTAQGRRVVILRAFIKKTQKTLPRELALARQRAKEVR